MTELNLRSWRNRQTRTFEGRMGDRMGSSPIDRTRTISTHQCVLLFIKSVVGLDFYSRFIKDFDYIDIDIFFNYVKII